MRCLAAWASKQSSPNQNKPCDTDSAHNGRPRGGEPSLGASTRAASSSYRTPQSACGRAGKTEGGWWRRHRPHTLASPQPAGLTWRCRPRKTTAKAPCPTRSLLLYSKSPTTSMAAPPGHTAGWRAAQRGGRDQHRRPAGPEGPRGPPDWGSRGPVPGRTLMPSGRSGNGRDCRAGPGSSEAWPGPGCSWPGPPPAAGWLANGLGAAGPVAPSPSLCAPGAARAPGRGAGPGHPHPQLVWPLWPFPPGRRCGGDRRPRTRTATLPARLPPSRQCPTNRRAPPAPAPTAGLPRRQHVS